MRTNNLIAAYFAETDELLSESPVHLTSLSTDIRHGSFKKSLVGLNGNANAMGDIFSSGESKNGIIISMRNKKR